MPSAHFKISFLATGLVALLSSWSARAQSEVVTYYGQGSGQQTLREYCDANPAITIIPIGFVTKFRNNGMGGIIETNFGNQCMDPRPSQAPADPPNSNFFPTCPSLEADIIHCQGQGKKILLSIGGGAGPYYLSSDAEATTAASDIWRTFGPNDPSWPLRRPFGAAVVDGFDLDLEMDQASAPHYAKLASELRALFEADGSKTYCLSAAPQCIYPDANLHPALLAVKFEYIFVQFYNNPSCRPTNAIHSDQAVRDAQALNFQQWNSLAASNAAGNTKWYLGLIASDTHPDYTSPTDLRQILTGIQSLSNFGGVMIWDVTSATRLTNPQDVTYIEGCKHSLDGAPADEEPFAPSNPTPPYTVVTGPDPPGQTHLAAVDTCNQWYLVVTNDNCDVISTKSQGTVTPAEIQAWNGGPSACGNDLWLDYWICVGVSGTATTTTATTSTSSTPTPFVTEFPSPPSPTQDGVAANCDLWHLIADGEGCDVIAAGVGNGVTSQDIIDWNPIAGPNCWGLWAGYYACVGVDAAVITTTTTAATTTTESTTTSTTSTDTTTTTDTTTSSDSTTSTTETSTTESTSSSSTETTSTETTTSTDSSSTTSDPTTDSSSTTTSASTTTTSSFDPGHNVYPTGSTTTNGYGTAKGYGTTSKSCTSTTLKKTTTKAYAGTTTPVYAAAYAKPSTTKKATTTTKCTKKTTTTTRKSTTTTKCTKKYRRSAPTTTGSYVPSYPSANSTATQNTTVPASESPLPYTGDAHALGLPMLTAAAAVAFVALLQAL
ncbi:hypothetical protein Dda_0366 [Drechslerella dactyloides]|uniref:Chitinase Dda_0366 n=1 Tax=Drechslerella dactyloides TaxID=74499 RepID=CHIT2_DREDA|nr:hypothetical protein Dda_0366 [Drechslerella dactyloides]